MAGCAHIAGFMAGAIKSGLRAAKRAQSARSSPMPWAILAMRLAVAGAKMMRSASRASLICPISCSSSRENKSVYTV